MGRFLFAAFCLWMGWLIERPPEPKALFLLTGIAIALWLAYDIFKPINERMQVAQQKAEEARSGERLANATRKKQAALATEWETAPPLPTKATISAHLTDTFKTIPRVLSTPLISTLAWQSEEIKIDRTTIRPAEALAIYQRYVAACSDTIRAYVDATALPAFPPGSFAYRYDYTEQEVLDILSKMRATFRTHYPEWHALPFEIELLDTSDYEKRDGTIDWTRYNKASDAIYDKLSPAQTHLLSTPLFHAADAVIPKWEFRPLLMPAAARFAGMWVIAPPGRGKTNLLHNLIADDIRKACTIVLMDSKGDLINSYKGYDDVVVIDPQTVEINPFQLGSSTRTLDFLEYIFSALLETKLTPKQTTLFRCCLALMLKIPDATIETFRKVLVHGWKSYEPYVMELDEDNRDFFHVEGRKSEFDGGQYNETKQEVLQRLRLLVSNDYLKQIFTAPQSNTDFFKLLDSGKTIIIDNSKDVLGENGAEFFGRFFVAMVWMAAVSRSKLRPEQKVPVYFYIDECQTVIKRDTKITTILDECRSQKIALILAHQRIGQIEPNVMDALNNCAIRLANSDDDAEALAKRFRVEAAALRLPIGQFSCFVRDTTPTAVTINVPEFDMNVFPPAPEETSRRTPRRAAEPPRAPPRAIPTDEVEDF